MRYSRSLLLAMLSTLLFAAPTRATKSMLDAQPGFALTLTVAGQPRIGEEFRVRVAGGAVLALRDAIGDVHLRIPTGIEVVAGATARQFHASRLWMGAQDREWDLYLRPTEVGVHTIRGWMRISRGSPRSWDETECTLDLDVRADTVIVPRSSKALRYERVVDGQRFRYGWEHMVLIDGPEPWLADTPGPRKDPEAIDHPPAVCKGCGLTEPKVVRYVVTVGTNGTVSWIEPRSESAPPEDPRVLAAAEDALKRWRFRPARLGDRIIANWTAVDVPVLPGAK